MNHPVETAFQYEAPLNRSAYQCDPNFEICDESKQRGSVGNYGIRRADGRRDFFNYIPELDGKKNVFNVTCRIPSLPAELDARVDGRAVRDAVEIQQLRDAQPQYLECGAARPALARFIQ